MEGFSATAARPGSIEKTLGFAVSLSRWERDRIWVDFGRCRGNCMWILMLMDCDERDRERDRASANISAKQQCLHQQCSKCNSHLQDLTLCLTTTAAAIAAPPPHGEEGGRPGGACCYASVCTRNSNLPHKIDCSIQHFFPERTG